MKLKVCGMKYEENILKVSRLEPDYLGFIFYEKSSRNFEGTIPKIPESIKKVGVFVDAEIGLILSTANSYHLDAIQLHGNESENYITDLIRLLSDSAFKRPEITKAFSVSDEFDFSTLKPYMDIVDYFLFDTKGKLPGGNGITFDWNILEKYPYSKPFFLSGGIGLDEIHNIKEFKKTEVSNYCYAIDVNSKFEIGPGVKKMNEIEIFKNEVQH